jgi:hypothetical protein
MIADLLRFLSLFCGVFMACGLAGFSVIFMAWIMSRRDNGWDR